MSTNTQHHILHRTVPLICQALITSPDDETVWTEGFRILSNPKLQQVLPLTTSIWLPLLLKGLETTRPRSVTVEALKLLVGAAGTLEPMKSCLIKPLRALGKSGDMAAMEYLTKAVERLDITVRNEDNQVIGKGPRSITSYQGQEPKSVSQVEAATQHPLLAEILAHNLPPKPRSVQHAWTHTLLSSAHDSPSVWLHSLYQATLEASGIPEVVITSRLGSMVHGDIFQTAFLKCYTSLEDDPVFMSCVDRALIDLLSDRSISRDILVVILDLLAFCSKERKSSLSHGVQEAARACAFESFRGALNQLLPGVILWYMEQYTEMYPTQENVSNIVEANIRVGSSGYDAAWSSLLWLENDWNVEPDPMWITSLSHWQEGLDAQLKIDETQETTMYSSFNIRMICYHALGDYQKGYELAQNYFEGLNDIERRTSAHWATAAAWHMGDFDTMADYLAFHPKGTSKSLYKAIIDVRNEQYASAFHHINKAQSLSYDELQVKLGVGPQVALKSLAKTEFLVELQEAIQYKSQPELRESILNTWKSRFKRSHADANSWLKRLEIWTLACPPTTFELQSCFLNTAKLCESAGMHEAAQSIIRRTAPEVTPPGCKVEYTKLRFDWKDAFQKRDQAAMEAVYQRLNDHTDRYLQHMGLDRDKIEASGLGLQPLSDVISNQERLTKLIVARRYYRLGEWTAVLQGSDWLQDENSLVLTYTSLASKLDESWYGAAFSLAERSVTLFESNGCSKPDGVAVGSYIVPALRGLFQASRTKESPEFVIKALLRLVTLWFSFGESQAVLVEVENQLNITQVDTWLAAIPQLIARLGTPHKDLQYMLINLLKTISSRYPHAVIWPLLTATQTQKVEHHEAARVVMNFICTMPDGTRLVDQAELVGKELIRVSISLMEKWRSIIDRVLPRREIMDRAWHELPEFWEEDMMKLQYPETPDEEKFVRRFGNVLLRINKTLLRYKSTRQMSLVNSVYTELYKLWGELDAHLNQWKVTGNKLHLGSTAPRLLTLRDCILTVPGKYDPHIKLDDQAFIDSFHPTVHLLFSKMLPRKLVIRSYMADHTFLLKGNEDLRGDERIMQLFSLINTLLNHRPDAFSRNLHLLPYEVIPLSPSAGLVSWVPNTQQLQSMIQTKRDKYHQQWLNDAETSSILGYDPENGRPKPDQARMDVSAEMDRYDKLPVNTKVQRLKSALSHSDQSDIRDVLWQRSPNSDVWIRRRTNFARTLGVGSFVGYIIGLGDRHGSNILVDQLTWGALHIDFGDLFDVAQERSYLPEKVPFRLTRMMTNAFELASRGGLETPGSRGSYKQASLIAMDVLSDSRSTLLAMLEAFLYDPLLSWTNSGEPSSNVDTTDAPTPDKEAQKVKSPHRPSYVVPQSVAVNNQPGDMEGYYKFENSLVSTYMQTDSYLAKVEGNGMTNGRALQVLGQIEKKLIGFHQDNEQPLSVNKQVQKLIEEATDLKNLSQVYLDHST
ncbi:hypothetical protein L202_02731 [Cryptococcus amylolentus CBS 6039]|uniref:non-specific serine/threonine protein kinase n=1 Tax=Cryptococcus amylolentus CBS 6039 TaxID=1295533 RepID=A0A1E3HW16_9TREE|nr:hypothetical protein L202_02731 [Cryptococcus amylolentus CBS 6039]ODN80500.1 hypothetical protein L202_02731 [Cryptococcus amylolentus CBS 6039]